VENEEATLPWNDLPVYGVLDGLCGLMFWYSFSILMFVHEDATDTFFIGIIILGCWLVRYGIAKQRGL
jgi:hypothetical protein